jgi:DNA-binding phage protein
MSESGLTVYRILKDAEITTDSLYRFLAKERDLRFETAASIAQVLGLQLVSAARE